MLEPVEPTRRRVLVTGARGFIGRHVVSALDSSCDVFRLVRQRGLVDDPREVVADLFDPASLDRALNESRPDVVIHLAGATPPSAPTDLYRVNIVGTLHLPDALRKADRRVRLVSVGSAAELGPVDEADLPVGESYKPWPVEPYGMSKRLATEAVLLAKAPIEALVARVFNPIGPGTPPSQALGRFAWHLARETELDCELTVGDLAPKRDFIDARDVARALIDLSEGGESGLVYHVGTGRSHSVGEGLEHLIALSGKRVRVTQDPTLMKRTGPSDSRADITRIVEATGWTPAISWEQSLADLWDDAVKRRG